MAKEVNKRVNVFINGKEVENNIKSIRGAMAQLTNQLNKMTIGSKEYNDTSEKLKTLKKIYDDHVKSLKSTRDEVENLSHAQRDNALVTGALVTTYSGYYHAFQKFLSSTQQYVDAYATIDDAMTGVMKTTGMTREEVEALHESLKGIDTRTSTEELLTIAQIGGRMGLAKDQIEDFTRAVDLANVALGDSFSGGAEEISAVLGKISLAFKETRDANIGDSLTRIGSAINEVGGSANATEPNIAAFVQRVGSMPEAFRPSVQEAIALGAAFEESSIDAEVASRAFGILMNKASTDVEGFAKVMEKPVEAVRELINSNPTQFFTEFAKSLQGMNATQIGETLNGLGLNADGVKKIVGAMSESYDRFNEILQTSNSAFAENVSMMNEYNNVNNNAAAQLEKAKKAVVDAKAALGEELMPVITKATEVSAGGLRIAAEFTKFMLSHPKLLIGLAAAYTALYAVRNAQFIKDKAIAAFTATRTALLSTHKTVVLSLAVAKNTLTKNTTRAAAAQKMLKTAFASTPWGAIITAVTTLGIAFFSLVDNQNKAADASDKFSNRVDTAKTEAKLLFEQLDKTTEGSEEYRAKLEEIEKLYPDIIQSHKDENGLLVDKSKALKEICDRLETEIALEMSKEERTDVIRKSITDQNKALRGFNEEQRKVIREMAEQGESVEEIGHKLGLSYFFTDYKGDLVKDERFEALSKYVKAYSKMRKDLDAIDKKYSVYGVGSEVVEEEIEPEEVEPSKDGKDFDKSIADFDKKLADFRKRQQNASLEGWAKTKQGIIDSYQEMIDEANKLGKEDVAEQLTQEKDSAIAAAGEKYMNKMTNMLVEFVKQAETLKADGGEESELSRIIVGTNEEWEKKIETLKENITTVKNFLGDLPEGDKNREVVQTALDQMSKQLIDSLPEQAKAVSNAIKEYTKGTDDFIKNEQKRAAEATMTEKEREIAAINERYDVEMERLREIIDERAFANAEDPELPSLMEKLELLKKMKDAAVAGVGGGRLRGGSVWEDLANIDWENFKDNWQDNLQTMTGALQEFAGAAVDIFDSINQARTNRERAEFNEFVSIQDEKAQKLKDRLEKGLISQEEYDKQMAKMDEERDAREKALNHEQFEREKRADIVKATITGIMAAMQSFLNGGGFPWGLIPMALSVATTAAQIGVIASQVNPYARGGYVNGAQVILAGEAGDEWIASSRLLKDRKTAPVIAALQEYQDGNRMALDMLPLSVPNWKKLSQASKNISRTFANGSSVNNYYTNSNNTTTNHTTSDNGELLAELRMMNNFLKDPKNRQAVISRKMQLEFDRQEAEIKNMARL